MKKIASSLLFLMFLKSTIVFASSFSIRWKEASNLPVSVGGSMVGWYEDKIVVAGGTTWKEGKKYYLSETYFYNQKTDRWDKISELPNPLGYGAGVSGNNKFYVLSGTESDTPHKEVYFLTKKWDKYYWQLISSLSEPRIYSAADFYKKSIYLIGGTPDPGNLDENTLPLLAYNTEKNQFSILRLPPGILPHLATFTTCKENLYLFGGCITEKGKVKNLGNAYQYNPSKDEWKKISSLPYSIRGLSAVSYKNRYIFLLGGYRTFCTDSNKESYDFTDAILVYDTKTDTYTEITPLPYKAMGVLAVIKGNAIYIGGGEDKPRHRCEKFFIGRIESK